MKKEWLERGITGFFFVFLAAVSGISMVKPQRVFSESENRYLQKRPEFSVSALLDGSFGEKYEAYLSDQFPGRNQWIAGKVLAERVQGKTDVNGVYLGKDGYLIEKFDREDIDGEQLTKNQRRFAPFERELVSNLGEDHVRVMMVPSASQILADKLPAWAAPYDQKHVFDDMRKESAGFETMVWVEEKLKAHQEEEIYYRADHHWTALGAYYGYQSWAESLGIAAWPQSDFLIETVSEDFLGTIHSKLNVAYEPDSIQLYLPIKQMQYQVRYDGEEKLYDSLYQKKALGGKDKYSVYLDGNHGLTEITNLSAAASAKGRRLLIIKDSFAHSFAPFAANHFETTYLLDLRYFRADVGAFIKEQEITDFLMLYQIPGFAADKNIRF